MSWVGPAIQAGGSILGGMAGGKGSKGPSAPKWLRHSARDLGASARDLAQTPYTPYEGNRVAPFSPDTQAAFDMIRNNVGTTQPYYASALDTSQRLQNSTIAPQQATAAQFAGTDLSPYMNPYTNEVINASLGDIAAQRLEQQQRLKSEAQAADAFGNSRYGVMLGQYEADTLRDQGNLAAQLRNQGFNTAADLAMQDISARNAFGLQNQALDFQGQVATADMQNRNAFLTGILGDRMGAANAQDAESMGRIGSAQDARTQQQLDVDYGDYWDRTRAYPSQQLSWWTGGINPGVATAGLGGGTTGGGVLGALGGAQLGAQAGSAIYDWWGGLNKGQSSAIDPYDSYNDWQG